MLCELGDRKIPFNFVFACLLRCHLHCSATTSDHTFLRQDPYFDIFLYTVTAGAYAELSHAANLWATILTAACVHNWESAGKIFNRFKAAMEAGSPVQGKPLATELPVPFYHLINSSVVSLNAHAQSPLGVTSAKDVPVPVLAAQLELAVLKRFIGLNRLAPQAWSPTVYLEKVLVHVSCNKPHGGNGLLTKWNQPVYPVVCTSSKLGSDLSIYRFDKETCNPFVDPTLKRAAGESAVELAAAAGRGGKKAQSTLARSRAAMAGQGILSYMGSGASSRYLKLHRSLKFFFFWIAVALGGVDSSLLSCYVSPLTPCRPACLFSVLFPSLFSMI
jgi:hypothetical protein